MSRGGLGVIGCAALIASACIEPRGHHEPGQEPTLRPAPGTVPLGATCGSFEDCASVAGKSVGCRCTDHAARPLCVVDAEAGEPCGGAASVPCRPGLLCGQTSAGGDFVCVPLGQAGDGCTSGGCADDLYCDATSHCAVPVAAAGEPCFGLDAWSCRAPAVCGLRTDVCTAPIPVGQPCGSNIGGRSECGRGAFCTLALGERDGLCQAQKADGAECLVEEECASGICFALFCGRGYPASVIVSCGP